MPEHTVGLQGSAPKQDQQHQQTQQQNQQQRRRNTIKSSSIGEFIADDLKLFCAPMTAVVNEFKRQVKR
jgi:hypothetical protein